MLTAENGYSSRSAKVLETQRRIFGRADVVLMEQSLTAARKSTSDVVEGVAGVAGLTAPVSCPAFWQDLPSLL